MGTTDKETRRRIVKARWRARSIWTHAVKEMPDSYLIMNDNDGYRLKEPERVDLHESKEKLMKLKDLIFHKNYKKHYLGLSQHSQTRVSYAAEPEHKFSGQRRKMTRLMRYITREFIKPSISTTLKLEISERALELFTEQFNMSAQDLTYKDYFHVLEGSDIQQAYENGCGQHTCMTGEEAYITYIYTHNDNCKLLVFDNNEYAGRALLWKTEEGVTVMDRIYPNSGAHIPYFTRYAEEHGYPMRETQGYPEGSVNGRGIYPIVNLTDDGNYTIKLYKQTGDDNLMPYMDTFHWYDTVGGRRPYFHMTNKPEGFEAERIANSTSGGSSEFNKRKCYRCDIIMETDINWDYHPQLSVILCENCSQEYTHECDRCEQVWWIDRSYTINTEDGQGQWCRDCTEDRSITCNGCHERFDYNLTRRGRCPDCYTTWIEEIKERDAEERQRHLNENEPS